MMKKDRSMAGMLFWELAVGAAELILIGAAFFGVLYAIGFLAELFHGMVSVSTAVFVIFTIAGVLLYIDFRPSRTKKPTAKDKRDSRNLCGIDERKAIRACSAR